ncbi:MAG: DNA/RNA non-specific endonuclease [Bacteroidota bacterium]
MKYKTPKTKIPKDQEKSTAPDSEWVEIIHGPKGRAFLPPPLILSASRFSTIPSTENGPASAMTENEGQNSGTESKEIIPEENKTHVFAGKKGNWNKAINIDLNSNHKYLVNDYLYETDEKARVYKVSGKLRLANRDRNTHQQTSSVKKKDGIKGQDEGGHIIACIFDGPGEQINYWPQLRAVNRSEWRKMEIYCKQELGPDERPNLVFVKMLAYYQGVSKRPIGFSVKVRSNGKTEPFHIDN